MAQTVIVDNVAPDFSIVSGSGWFATSNPGSWPTTGPTNTLLNLGDSGSEVVRWRPTLPSDGNYRVSGWWVASSNRSTASPFTIEGADGPTTVLVNQRVGANQWNEIGTFRFDAGNSGSVTLSDAVDPSAYVAADALRFEFLGGAVTCQTAGTALTTLGPNSGCASSCTNLLLPGKLEDHPDTKWTMHSDLPEIFLTPGVLHASTPILPPDTTAAPISLAMRTQVNPGNSFTSIDGTFDVFVFHISSPGDGSQPRRVVTYVRNDGTGPVTIDNYQILITDGTIGNVHEMESTLGRRELENAWDRPIPSVTIQPGAGAVVAYSKRFPGFPNGPDMSANVNCFGRVRGFVNNPTAATNPTRLSLFVVGIQGDSRTSQTQSLTEAVLGVAANSGETQINMKTTPAGCELRRAVGVFRTFVWRNDPITIDANAIPAGNGRVFTMAASDTQTGTACPAAQQTQTMALYPPYTRPDTTGNYMIEYRLRFELVNRNTTTPKAFDIKFGRAGYDLGLAWQVATNPYALPSDDTVDAAPVRTGWAGPNQTATHRSMLADDGGTITLPPCGRRFVSARFLVLGNSSLPLDLQITQATATPVATATGLLVK